MVSVNSLSSFCKWASRSEEIKQRWAFHSSKALCCFQNLEPAGSEPEKLDLLLHTEWVSWPLTEAVPIGCSTEVGAHARPYRWWKAGTVADIAAGRVEVLSLQNGSRTRTRTICVWKRHIFKALSLTSIWCARPDRLWVLNPKVIWMIDEVMIMIGCVMVRLPIFLFFILFFLYFWPKNQ